MTQAQESHNEARRRDAEEAVESLLILIDDRHLEEGYRDDLYKALEFLAWEAGVLDYFKKLRFDPAS